MGIDNEGDEKWGDVLMSTMFLPLLEHTINDDDDENGEGTY